MEAAPARLAGPFVTPRGHIIKLHGPGRQKGTAIRGFAGLRGTLSPAPVSSKPRRGNEEATAMLVH